MQRHAFVRFGEQHERDRALKVGGSLACSFGMGSVKVGCLALLSKEH